MNNQRIMVSFSAGTMKLCSPKYANSPSSLPASYSISIGGVPGFPAGKLLECETNHLIPCSEVVKNKCCYTTCALLLHVDNFNFIRL
jgi:hypothetical protein